jgi:hypothetical protein
MRRSRLLPFRFTPASWGLSGQPYEEAEICYYYEGEEQEVRLAKLRNSDGEALAKALVAIELKYGKLTKYEADRRNLEIDGRGSDARALLDLEFTHGRVDEYEYGRKIIEIEKEGVERDVALLDHDLAHDRIEGRAHAKAVATAQGIPWVGVVNDEFNHNLGVDGFAIELDWNKEWIDYLKMNGYVGRSDADIVDQWFMDVCREQTDAQVDYGSEPFVMDAPPRQRGPFPRLRQ